MTIFAKSKHVGDEWKRVRKEKLLKIKRRIELILDKEHSITAKEKSWRDAFFRPVAFFCRTLGIRANYISLAGVLLVCISIYFFLSGSDTKGLTFAILAAFSDMIDGPIARFRYTPESPDDITAFGTFLDHFRDYFLALSFGYFTFFHHNVFRPIELGIFITIVLIYIGIFIGTSMKLRRYKIHHHSLEKNLYGFLLPEMQTSFWGRAQFFLLILGTVILFLGKTGETPWLIMTAYIIFGIHIGINFRNLLEEYIVD